MTNKFDDGTMVDMLRRPVVSYSQLNDSSWITVHPNGQGTKGVPVRISENGTIEAGMGGKHNGKKLGELKETRKTSEMSVSERESSEAPARQSSAQNKTPANPSGVKLNKNQNSIVNKINHLIGVDITKAIEPRFTKGNRIQIHTSELPNNALNQIKRISNQYGGFTVQEGGALRMLNNKTNPSSEGLE